MLLFWCDYRLPILCKMLNPNSIGINSWHSLKGDAGLHLARRFIAFLLLLAIVLTVQQSNPNSISASSQTVTSPAYTEQASMTTTSTSRPTQTTYQTSITAQTTSTVVTPAQIANLAAWSKTMRRIPAPQAGCFMASYPNTVWQPTQCTTAPLRPFQPMIAPLTVVGNGNDWAAQSSSTLIGSSTGSFTVSGLTSEADSLQGANYYSLQDNSNTFTTSTTYTGSKSTTGWQQFILANEPGNNAGKIFIQYWLINYQSTYGSCPSTGPPGAGASPWIPTPDGKNCFANSP